MYLNEPEAIRCPFKAGEVPETLEYPCSVCKIARTRRRKKHRGKHLECTFDLDRKKSRKMKAESPKAPPEKARNETEPEPAKKKPKREKPRRAKNKRRGKELPQPPIRDDYDGYYDDVLPLDHGSARQGLDTAVAQKVVVLIIVVLLIVAACVLVMYFL